MLCVEGKTVTDAFVMHVTDCETSVFVLDIILYNAVRTVKIVYSKRRSIMNSFQQCRVLLADVSSICRTCVHNSSIVAAS
jgi:hypothetical protein